MERIPQSPLGFSQIHDEQKLPCIVTPEEAYRKHYFNKPFFVNAPSSAIIRRSEFEKEGGFKPIRHRGDYEFWLRMGAKYPIVRLPAFIGWNYHHEGQELSLNHLYKKALNYNLSIEALHAPYCPLSKDEIIQAEEKWKRGFVRLNILQNLMRGKLNDVKYLMKECKVSIKDVISAIA